MDSISCILRSKLMAPTLKLGNGLWSTQVSGVAHTTLLHCRINAFSDLSMVGFWRIAGYYLLASTKELTCRIQTARGHTPPCLVVPWTTVSNNRMTAQNLSICDASHPAGGGAGGTAHKFLFSSCWQTPHSVVLFSCFALLLVSCSSNSVLGFMPGPFLSCNPRIEQPER